TPAIDAGNLDHGSQPQLRRRSDQPAVLMVFEEPGAHVALVQPWEGGKAEHSRRGCMIAEAEHSFECRQFSVDGRVLRSFLHPRIYVVADHGAAHVHYPQGPEKGLQMFRPARLRVTEALSTIDAVIA